MQLGQGFAGTKSGKIKTKIKRVSLTTHPNRKKLDFEFMQIPLLHKLESSFYLAGGDQLLVCGLSTCPNVGEVYFMRPWEWLSLIEESKNVANNVGVAAGCPSVATVIMDKAATTLVNQVNPVKAASKQVNHTIRLMTDLEIRELATKQKPSYFAKLKKKAYDKQLCSKEGHFWAMLERLSQEFAKKNPNEFDLQLWTKLVKYAQRDWEIEKLQSSLNAKCSVCGSIDFVFVEKGQQKGFVCLQCLKTTGRVEFAVNVKIENDVPEWIERITLGTGHLVPNSRCTRCGAVFKWFSSDKWEGWLCSDCGEEFIAC